MKAAILALFLAVPAHAATLCKGVVATPSGATSPIELEITWKGTSGDALVKISVDGKSGSEDVLFQHDGHETRCGPVSNDRAMVVLDHGLYSYYVDFYSSIGCGFSTHGTYLSDTMESGPNHGVKLDCQEI